MAAPVAEAGNIYHFCDARWVAEPVLEPSARLSPGARAPPHGAPIVIDGGSFQTRAGWASAEVAGEPRLVLRSLAARSRGAPRGETQVGRGLAALEPLRCLLRSHFDRNVVVNLELQELVFDHIFQQLGVNSQGCVDHPVVLTEPPCNPLYCRQMMSELLFECYHVPKVSYGIDSLYSFYQNKKEDSPSNGLIISSGYHCTHILPVLNGRLDARNCKRINLGGSHSATYLQRLLQLKYPGHLAAITMSRVEEILHEHSYVAEDYIEELEKWRSPEYYEKNVHRMQLPFSTKLLGSTLTAEEKMERRQQQLRRLQELNARRREEKLQLDQDRLEKLLSVQELLEEGQLEQFHKALVGLNMDSAEELQSYINKLNVSIEQTRQKILQAEVNIEVDVVDTKPDTPDLEHLDEVEGMQELETLFPEEPPEIEKLAHTIQPMFNLAEYHQLFLGTERLRVTEILFQPSLIGEEQAGIAETIQYMLDRYSKEQQAKLVQNVFLTGGNMMYPGMKSRIQKELLALRPFQSYFQVNMASNPVVDAWYGARDWALDNTTCESGWITKADYEEKGGEYLKEHCASNLYVPISLAKPTLKVSEPST
ncbi:actin-related protein 5 [Latimeria chalumnae]|uniref:Actin-related protein 5 n=1 Tax=Latimeria chalumnae TaxID=7897 RepID=H3B3Q1_LATCH|nr:PREDICTED: actin-related protein 5 [Latimeria chalumnae]|eukprot:XP_005990468.1 PREDICTED: actin-related protein 5 [Latimeria chalumnae]